MQVDQKMYEYLCVGVGVGRCLCVAGKNVTSDRPDEIWRPHIKCVCVCGRDKVTNDQSEQ